MRILLVSQMWPGPADPDLGAFVALVAGQLERQGHLVERAAIDRRGGTPAKYARLAVEAVRRARRVRPDVVYAHFLFPAGLAGLLAARSAGVPLVLTAHGQDVRNLVELPAVRAVSSLIARRAAGVIAVSGYLRDALVAALPELRARVEVIDCGVDLERFAPRDGSAARRRLGLPADRRLVLFVGTLSERKNVLALADACAMLADAELVLVGDGPLRPALAGRPGVRLVGAVAHACVPEWIAAADVLALPSIVEPLGQVLLEAMAGGRSVLATRVGGPPELVAAGAGVLVDPTSVEQLAAGLREALALPRPNVAAVAAARAHDAAAQARRVAAVLERAIAVRAGA